MKKMEKSEKMKKSEKSEKKQALVLAAGAATGGRVASFASQVATMADGSRWMVHASRGVEVSLGDEGCALAFDFAGFSAAQRLWKFSKCPF